MDPHRWPPAPGGGSHPDQNQSQGPRPGAGYGTPHQQSAQSPPSAHSGLPPPPPAFGYHPQPAGLASLAGISQSSPRQPPSSAHRSEGPPGFPLPNITQATGQPGAAERERERERQREAEHIHIKEEEDRRHREEEERRRMGQAPPHQPGPPMLHQPVAVGPRSVHGPNGLLGGAAALQGPPPQGPPGPQQMQPLGAPSGPANIFGGPVQPAQQQQMQPNILLPFGAPQQHAQAAQQQQQMGQQGQGQQPILNDALSYLDQVKVQFADSPDVYNKFLDIMKDFKSGAIDTPGVIGRVSQLFAGNPELIQGFNTFLPPGYRIECGLGDNPNAIRVTTPQGTTVHNMPEPRPLSRIGGGEGVESMGLRPSNGTYTPQPGAQSAQMVYSPSGRPLGPTSQGTGQQQHLSPLDAARQQEAIHAQEQRGVSSLQNAVSAAAAGAGGLRAGASPRGTPGPGQGAGAGDPDAERRPPVEFNHAISYVNKIKNRFSQHPDIYKQFLEILQTYQRESKPIQDVYGQVTRLFSTAPDLLDDFKQFLPESAAAAKAAERGRMAAEEGAMLSNMRGGANDAGMYGSPVISREQGANMGTPAHGGTRGLPPVGNFAPTPMGKGEKKRKNQERQGTVESVQAGPSTGKGSATYGAGQTGNKRQKQAQHQTTGGRTEQTMQAVSPSLVPNLPAPIAPTTSAATSEELGFFDRAKKVISNKNTMNEFLKLCNLFSQDLIDATTLVHRAQAFIGGNPDLMKWFKEFLGYSEQDILIQNKARIPSGRVSLSNCRGLGPSYRLLPKRERAKPCSGRDELCNAVLNDEWASHPTWASEDSGFIAHRKNVHEEGLHRIEEERHDYDYNIEACARTIQLLEPIAQQLRRLSDAEQRAYQLPPGLGGQSETIYKRIIMKVYGRERGAEVTLQLHAHPYQVIPVILNRLKERLESWKMAQREWEKVWREQTQRMFWRSLDHQAVGNAKNDKRQFQTKTLQTEIAVKHEEMRRRELTEPGMMRRPQLSMEVQDMDVVVDAAYLILQYIHSNLETEQPRLAGFIREFVPLFFGLDSDMFNSQINSRFGGTPNERTDDSVMSGTEEGSGPRGRKPGKSLLRTALDRGRGSRMGRKDRDDSAASASRASTPDVASQAGDAALAGDEMNMDAVSNAEEGAAAESKASEPPVQKWFSHPDVGNSTSSTASNVDPNEPQKRDVYKLWANTPMYCFVRMFFILYERLYKVKASEEGCRETVRTAKRQKPAMELGIMDKTPEDFFADTSDNANYYTQVLGKLDDVLKGELEFSPDVEETLRRFYLQSGYPLYAFEKMIQQTGRYAVNVLNGEGKEKSWEIYQAFRRDRSRELSTVPQTTEYKKAVEKLVREGDIYRIDWEQSKQNINIFLAKKDDPAYYDDGVSPLDRENKWRAYVSSYQTIDPTDGVQRENINPPLLMRNMRAAGANPDSLSYPPSPPLQPTDGDRENGFTSATAVADRLANRLLVAKDEENLTLRIAVNGYKAHFQPNTQEGFLEPEEERAGGREGAEAAEAGRAEREDRMAEMFVRNHQGMKDMDRSDVEKANEKFAKIAEEGADAAESQGSEKESGKEAEGEKMEVDE